MESSGSKSEESSHEFHTAYQAESHSMPMFRVGQKPLYTVYIYRIFGREITSIRSYTCKNTVLANPTYIVWLCGLQHSWSVEPVEGREKAKRNKTSTGLSDGCQHQDFDWSLPWCPGSCVCKRWMAALLLKSHAGWVRCKTFVSSFGVCFALCRPPLQLDSEENSSRDVPLWPVSRQMYCSARGVRSWLRGIYLGALDVSKILAARYVSWCSRQPDIHVALCYTRCKIQA